MSEAGTPFGVAVGRLAAAAPDRPAITHENRTVTRGELERRTNRLARAYARLGVRPDSFVTIALPNGIAFFEASIAAWKLGATPQPISARLPASERRAILAQRLVDDEQREVLLEAGVTEHAPTMQRTDGAIGDPLAANEASERPTLPHVRSSRITPRDRDRWVGSQKF